MTQETVTKTDIYQSITNQIIADLEKGQLFWRKPWSSEHLAGSVLRPLRSNDIPYTGINTIVLWATAAEKGYGLPNWMTYNQAQAMKANVRKGEKGATVVYADKIEKEDTDDKGETIKSRIPFLKTYTVFNACQIEGLPQAYYQTPEPKIINPEQRDPAIDQMFVNTKADIYTGTHASYSQATDRIEMPPFEAFVSAKGFYAAQAHELVHWTKHPTRLDRDMGRKTWGDAGYAKEELVAELGACFLAADLGLEPKPAEDHAAYIQYWLKALQDDKRLIFSAASHAQKAVEFISALQPGQ